MVTGRKVVGRRVIDHVVPATIAVAVHGKVMIGRVMTGRAEIVPRNQVVMARTVHVTIDRIAVQVVVLACLRNFAARQCRRRPTC